MLDALSDALARQIFETHAADRSHAGADLDGIPPLVALALRQRLNREAGTRLDSVSPWLSATPEAWREAAMADARFPSYAWKPAVRETCSALLEALVAPFEALPKQLIPEGTAPASEVLTGLKGLGAYPYIAEIVRRYVEKKDVQTFEQEELSNLILRIDRRVAGELGVDGWMALLTPIYEVIGGIPEQEGDVPGMVLAEAFSARGCPGLGREVVSEMEVSRDTLRTILADALASGAPPQAPQEPEPPPEAEVYAVAPEAEQNPDAITEADEAHVLKEEEPLAEPAEAPERVEARSPEDDEPRAPEAEPPSASEFLTSLIEADDSEDEDALLSADEVLMGGADVEPESRALLEPLAPQQTAPPATEEEERSLPEAEAGEEAEVTADPEPDPEGETLLDRLARSRDKAKEPQAPEAPAAGDPLWKQFAHAGTPEAPAPAPTLHDAMSAPAPDAPLEDHEAFVLGEAASNRDWYTEHLFNGEADAYARVIVQLSGSDSWTDATQIIGREVFRPHKVNIYGEPAVSFTDAVESRLRPA